MEGVNSRPTGKSSERREGHHYRPLFALYETFTIFAILIKFHRVAAFPYHSRAFACPLKRRKTSKLGVITQACKCNEHICIMRGVSANLNVLLTRCTNVHTVVCVDYEWDPVKARHNLAKHNVDFADAIGALEDDLAITVPDPYLRTEKRFLTVGMDFLGRLLVVVYTWRGGTIRLISARKATRRERKQYEEGGSHA